jgi:hypothetical protein
VEKIRVAVLHPTQMTVGMREVTDKQKELAREPKDKRHEYLQRHPIPLVLGPDGKSYLIDHHHLARALWDDDYEHAWGETVADLSRLEGAAFWREMAKHLWVYPHDAHGIIRPCTELPSHVSKLVDDPYRSLAAYARNAGAYAKSTTPFTEFAWANFFRARITIAKTDTGFDEAVRKAVELAHGPSAAALPGYLA